jgi:hypothetical protein
MFNQKSKLIVYEISRLTHLTHQHLLLYILWITDNISTYKHEHSSVLGTDDKHVLAALTTRKKYV